MDNFSVIQAKWPEILEKLKQDSNLSAVSYKTWIQPLRIKDADSLNVTFLVDNVMGINVLNKKYTRNIRDAITSVTGLSLGIRYLTPDMAQEEAVSQRTETTFTDAMRKANLNPKYTFESFIVGSANQFAHAAAIAVAEAPGEIYNPLYLYSGVGLGKTHLMHSIAHFILEKEPEKKILYVTCETFTNEMIDYIQHHKSEMSEFRRKYRDVDVLLIDDIQFLKDKDMTQEEFFYTFESLYNAKKQIVVSSDKPPKEMDVLEERIRSRLSMGLIADIGKPDYETRMAILRKRNETEGFHIDDEILDYIAKNVHTNIRELEGCLNRIHAKGVLERKPIDLPYAQDILQDIISPNEKKQLTSNTIINTVAEHFRLSASEIRSTKRDAKYVHPRMIAMYLCREMTNDAYVTVANLLNKKDHTTVINGVKKVEKLLETSEETRTEIEVLRKKLSGNGG